MRYAAKFTEVPEGGYVVTFRDLPCVVTQAEHILGFMSVAQSALVIGISIYYNDKKMPLPKPTPIQPDELWVTVPTSTVAKMLLIDEMRKQKVRPTDLARMVGKDPQYMNRALNICHTTKIDNIEELLNALGKKLVISLADLEK